MAAIKKAFGQVVDAPPPVSPEDALATFLGIDDGAPRFDANGVGQDPALELASLRGARADELKARIPGEKATGDTVNATRDLGNFLGLEKDIATDSDTGDAARAAAEKAGAAYNTLVQENNPESEVTKRRQADENFKLRLAQTEHPPAGNSMASLFPAPVSANPEAPLSGPAMPPQPTIPAGSNPDQRFQAGTADLPEGIASLVKGLLSYQTEVPKGTALKDPSWLLALQRAQQTDPSFVASEYENRKKVMDDYRSGKKSNAVLSLNRMIGHLNDVNSAIGPLDNSNGTIGYGMNLLNNHLLRMNDPRLRAFQTPASAVQQEAGTLFHGQPSEEASRQFASQLDLNAGQDSQRQAVSSLGHLSQTVYQELADELRRNLRLPPGAKLPIDLLSPGNEDILKSLINQAQGGTASGGNPSSLPPGVSVRRLQ